MGLDKKYRQVTLLLAVIGLSAFAACAQKPDESEALKGGATPRQTVELFCKNEFVGDVAAARYDYAKVNTARELSEGNGPPDVAGDPMVVVSTYYISSVESDADIGKAKVIFERLAYTRGYGTEVNNNPNPPRVIIPAYNESEEVVYNLKKIAERWYVYDPPIMRVSLAATNKHYRKYVPAVVQDDFWIDPKFSNEQRKNIAKNFYDTGVLMQISNDYLQRLVKRYEKVGGPGYPDRERRQKVKGGYNGKWNLEIAPENK